MRKQPPTRKGILLPPCRPCVERNPSWFWLANRSGPLKPQKGVGLGSRGANKSVAEACTASDTETDRQAGREGASRVVLVLVVEAFRLDKWASAATAGNEWLTPPTLWSTIFAHHQPWKLTLIFFFFFEDGRLGDVGWYRQGKIDLVRIGPHWDLEIKALQNWSTRKHTGLYLSSLLAKNRKIIIRLLIIPQWAQLQNPQIQPKNEDEVLTCFEW